ncbi:hypothetical protein EJ03DRAFT_324877 [Teratosphaeria nubilosa]|uniref:Uncharacterized protein n=1 Tax=Teratosphaeria nubilosa TaxID=161662 RepID=A0A6G1LGG0_9PEZI|nr:hypothetical protein EJ03DRAFT_324877 [Teratosphaeria nubilosa]
MAAQPVPDTVTARNMTGVYVINKQLSESSNNVLKMQNVGFIVRQVVNNSTITVTLKQYKGDDGVEHFNQKQIAMGGTENMEERLLNWQVVEADNAIWGRVKGKTRIAKVEELSDDYLKEGWDDGEVIESYNESAKGDWQATQVYGFKVVDGLRRQVRRVVSTKGKQVEKIQMVYDWQEAA